MKQFQLTVDLEYVAQQIAEQCFYANEPPERLDGYLIGAAYTICFSLSKEKKWEKGEFISIGKEISKMAVAHYLSLRHK